MKKFLGIVALVLTSCTTIQPIDNTKWNCQKLSGKDYKCLKKMANGDNFFSVEFVGEAKENKPDGYGKIRISDYDFNFSKVSLDGVVKIPNDGSILLIDGWRDIDGLVFYEKNSKVYKITWPNGSIWEGAQLKKKEGSKYTNLKGTYISANPEYRFEGIILDKLDAKLVEGTLYWLNGSAKGNIFTGTFNVDIEEDGFVKNNNKNIINKGKYNFVRTNNEEILYYEGTFYENGFLKKGVVAYRNYTVWEKYVGTHNNNGTFNDGKLYFRNGTVMEYKSGKTTTAK